VSNNKFGQKDKMINKIMVLCLGLAAISFAGAAEQPNIVIFLADDHGRAESSVYGSYEVRTPMMASLAKNGLVFNNAFVASPACGPSRSAMLSGLMPARNGAKQNHQPPRPETQIMVKQLKAAGYEVAAFGKVAHFPHLVGFDEHFPKNTGLAETVKNYLNQRKSDKPLCLIVGDRRPHVPWTRKMDYDPSKITLPSHFVDTPETREHWARYLTDITGMDAEMAKIDALARGYFGNDDFLFMYTADHGGQWPFGKWNLYDSGIIVPMIVRWPGKIAADTRTEAMVSWIDIFPTLLDLTGGTIPANIDGKSFAGVLLGKADTHRDVIFTTTTADGDKNIYPMRSVRTERFKYIRNIYPDTHHSNHSDILRNDGAGGYWDSWDEAAKTDPKAKAIIAKYYQRPAIEFYNIEKDPNEQVNLANNPEYKDQIAKMSSMVDEWMKEQDDTVIKKSGAWPIPGPTPHELLLLRKARATNARAQIKIKTVVPTSQNKPVSWRYTLDTPKEDWFNTDFDDSAWKTGDAPFGREAPAASRKPNTVWTSKDIWLRCEFEMPAGKFEDLSLILNYDENATIYINGVLAARAPGYNGAYELVKLTPKAIAAIKPGKNRFAVHCRNVAGGQYIDLGLGVYESIKQPAK
jgi:N-sulfoglucosamine sulfohydrolase